MPTYGIDGTATDMDLDEELSERLIPVARDVVGPEAVIERWRADGYHYYRVVTTVSRPTILDVLHYAEQKTMTIRDTVGIAPGRAVGVSIAIRDFAHPADMVIPPPRTVGG